MHLPERPLRCAPAAIAGNVLTLAALLLLPLYMPSGYVGLVDAKFHLLLWLAGAGAALLVWRLWLGLRGRAPAVRLDLATALPLPVLCLSYTVAWFFAEDRALALWGLAGRYNGLLMLLACTVLYFVVRLVGGGVPSVWFGRLLAGAGCAVTLLSWLNFFMADPLDAYYSFLPGRGGLFLGTVGNINFYGALLDICLPIAVWELLTAPDRDTARRCGGPGCLAGISGRAYPPWAADCARAGTAVFGYAVQAFFSISMPGVLPLVFVLAALCVKSQPLAARGEYRCLLGLALAAPPVMLLAAL